MAGNQHIILTEQKVYFKYPSTLLIISEKSFKRVRVGHVLDSAHRMGYNPVGFEACKRVVLFRLPGNNRKQNDPYRTNREQTV
ncbi:hypothetical protein D3C77_653520 [compost metagenome]